MNHEQFRLSKVETARQHYQSNRERFAPKQISTGKKYYLGDAHPSIYLTEREMETFSHLILGKTINVIGEAMGLSPRTVEFYIRNMRLKLRCRTRGELIEAILSSDLRVL